MSAAGFRRGYYVTPDGGTVYASRRLPEGDDLRDRYCVGAVAEWSERNDRFETNGTLLCPYSDLATFVSTGRPPVKVKA